MVSYRTPLSRARGLGSAQHGAGHWISERVTSIALVPLSLWAVCAGLALAAILAIQVVDVSSMAHAIHGQTRDAGRHQLYLRTFDPRWDALIATARDVTFVPAEATRDLSLFQEVAWRASSLGRPVRLVYAARDTEATYARHMAEDAAFLRGELDPHRLYVLLPETPVPTAARSRLIILDGIRMIAPAR